MEEEIDLRPYFAAIIKNWYWVLGAAVGTAVVAFIISSFLPRTYETTALVAVTEPNRLVQFEAGFENIADIVALPLRAYPEIANSDEVMQSVLAEMEETSPGLLTLGRVRGITSATSGSDLSLIRLTVQYNDAELAAQIANVWARIFVEHANRVYSGSSDGQLAALETQLEQVTTDLEAAENALVDFQSRNRLNIVNGDLQAFETSRANLLSERVAIESRLRNISGQREMLLAQQNDTNNLANQLVALYLQIDAFSDGTGDGAPPVSLQINGESGIVTADTRREQVTILENLAAVLQAQLLALEAEIETLEPQILALQEERETFLIEQNQLTRDRDTAEESYTVLARRVEEERIVTQDLETGVQLASLASVKGQPVAPNSTLNGLIAAVFGVTLSLAIILGRVWWRLIGGLNGVQTADS